MGSGKSFWASSLAANLGVPYVDLDALLEADYLHESISNFIKKKGEIRFRKLERQALLDVTVNDEPMILATGGGTPCYFNNMDVLNKNFFTVYLNVSIKTIVSRLKNNLEHRPLISHLKEDEITEFVAKHLFERRQFYAQAKLVLTEDQINIETILKALPSKK